VWKVLRENRKYTVFWAVFLIETALRLGDIISGSEYKEMVIFVTGLYMAGNVGEHMAKRPVVPPSGDN